MCPVCDYDKMIEAPRNYKICPCCGTEFGYDDFDKSNQQLREEWIAGGRLWWSKNISDNRVTQMRKQRPEFEMRVYSGKYEYQGDYIINVTQYGYNWSTIKLINKEKVHILIGLLQDAIKDNK